MQPPMPPAQEHTAMLAALEEMVQRTIRQEISGLADSIKGTFQEIRDSVQEVCEELRQERLAKERDIEANNKRFNE
eukprot:767700-Heterocapsa_arctica.AAC.1